MGKLILITGGSRSGKSAFAQQISESHNGPRLFFATCPVTDDEMAERIQRHVIDRQHSGWDTVEEQVDIVGRLKTANDYGVVLVDCLALWINNLMYEAQINNSQMSEDVIVEKTSKLTAAAKDHPGVLIFVTNEVGLGIVPDNQITRLYRDLVGRCNQIMASASDNVYLVSCGIPIHIKGKENAL